jgi:hypothetical protein
MLARLPHRGASTARAALQALRRRLVAATKPAASALIAGAIADLARSKGGLVAENALLRRQLAVLKGSVKRPRRTPADRTLLVLLADASGPGGPPSRSSSPPRSCAGIGGCSTGTGGGHHDPLPWHARPKCWPRRSC